MKQTLNRFLNLYPASDLAPYAQYLLGINYFDQIIEVTRDQTSVTKSLEIFKLILDRYPESNYAKDAYFKIIFLENQLAAKEIDIAMTYLGLKKYISALKRFKYVVNNYQTTNYTPEALHRLVEIYLILGVKEEALVNARVLGYNFPDSKWYKLSYNLLKRKRFLKFLITMLKSLSIKNIVLIENLKLNYNSGFSVFSGETGAGKSIILSSLGLAIGMRADFSLIRKGENEGSVTAEFQINKEHLAYKKIINHGLNSGNDLILRRVLYRDGVSKAFVNDNLVTANF